ncbi:MAG: glycosyltransferase family 4 protein [Desulfobacteraceae bacterium]|nr:glycosyltransferase family 4 protein [Desulfobacteraceae bacterium]MBC2720240.1 glycosyltransferase family 4 protein [Desulfobacteraceae bacterium]
MKIAVLGTKGIPGHHGVEVVVDSLVPHMTTIGHDVTVYGYDTYTEPDENYNGAKIKTVHGSSRSSLEMISHMWNSAVDTRQNKFDIIHIHSADPCLLAWLPVSKYGVMATSHGQAYLRKKWSLSAKNMSKLAERFFIRIPDVITSVSKPLSNFYAEKYQKKVHYIPNGITFRDKPDPVLLKKWRLTPKGFLFCSAGRIERTKGIHTLLDAFQKINTDLPLVIAGGGSGSDLAYFRELKEKNLKNVIFTGFLTGDEFYALYAHACIFIFPSEYEAMSMALLEGLSFGTPTIYSDILENQAVADGLGYAFIVSDPLSLADEIQAVLTNYDTSVERGKKAARVIRERHDWKSIAEAYNQVYQGLAERRGAGV